MAATAGLEGIPDGRIQTRPSVSSHRLGKPRAKSDGREEKRFANVSLIELVVSHYSQSVADWFNELTDLTASPAPAHCPPLTILQSSSLARSSPSPTLKKHTGKNAVVETEKTAGKNTVVDSEKVKSATIKILPDCPSVDLVSNSTFACRKRKLSSLPDVVPSIKESSRHLACTYESNSSIYLPSDISSPNTPITNEKPSERCQTQTHIPNSAQTHGSVPKGSASVLEADVRPFVLDDAILSLLSTNDPSDFPEKLLECHPNRIMHSVFTNLTRLFSKTSASFLFNCHLYQIPLAPIEHRALKLLQSLNAFTADSFLAWLRQRRLGLNVVQLHRVLRTALALMPVEACSALIYEIAVLLTSSGWSMKPNLPLSCLVLSHEMLQSQDSSLILASLRHLIALEVSSAETNNSQAVRQGLEAANWISSRKESSLEVASGVRKFLLDLVDNLLKSARPSDEMLLSFRLLIMATAFKSAANDVEDQENGLSSRAKMLKRRKTDSLRSGTLGWLLCGRLLPSLTSLIK